jgi:hypothetical protein
MPCVPILNHRNRRIGFACVCNDPIEIRHRGRTYRFEWTEASGWMAVNRDGSQRLSPVPLAVYRRLDKLPRPNEKEQRS